MATQVQAMAACILAVVVLLGVSVHGETPPGGKIESFTYSGSGCPQGSVAGEIGPDGSSLTLKFAHMTASNEKKAVSCNLKFVMAYDSFGWTFFLESVSRHGYASLDANVNAIDKAHYSIEGEPEMQTLRSVVKGKYDDNFIHSNKVSPLSSECGKTSEIKINMVLKLENEANMSGVGEIDIDSADFHVKWESCP